MKRCLTCQRVYSDESLKFCREDGGPLVVTSALGEAAETLHLSTPPHASHAPTTGDVPTRTLGGASAHSTVPPRGVETGRLKESRPRRKLVVVLAVLLLVVGGIALTLYLHGRHAGVAIKSIAVLPFDSRNQDEEPEELPDDSEGWRHTKRQRERDEELEELSDHLTEDILNNLTRLPNLRVAPRDAVFRYKKKDADPVTAGRELGVHAVLKGRVKQLGDRLTVSIELTDVRDNRQVWGGRYNCVVADLAAVQRNIQRELAEHPRLK
jgi:TolB-like protein